MSVDFNMDPDQKKFQRIFYYQISNLKDGAAFVEG